MGVTVFAVFMAYVFKVPNYLFHSSLFNSLRSADN